MTSQKASKHFFLFIHEEWQADIRRFTFGALRREAVAHPLDGDGGEVDTGDAAGDALPQELLPEPRAAAADLEDLHMQRRSGAPGD